MSSTYPILEGRPIDQWKVTELKEELRKRKLKTGGLKPELVKRLDEDIRNELEEQNEHGQENEDEEENELEEENVLEQENVTSNNGFDSAPPSEQQAVGTLLSDELEKDNTPGDDSEEQNVLTNEELNEGMEIHVTYEQERSDVFVSETIQDVTNQTGHISETVKDENSKTEVDDDSANANEETVEELKVVSNVESSSSDIKQETEVTVTVETEIVTESKVSVTSFSGGNLLADLARDESGDLKAKLESEDSGAELVDTKVNTSDPNNQVSEVIGFQVKSDSISTESVTINEKNELKDNIIADDVKLEPDVKPEMVYPSSSNDIPDDGKSHPMDVDEPQPNKVSVEETGADNAENEDLNKENDTRVLSSSEKLNLDRSSGDDFVEEDGMEVKQVESKPVSDEVSFMEKEVEAFDEKEEGVVDIVGVDIPDDVKVVSVEEKNGAALPPAKRKLDDDQKKNLNSDPTKRQRRWFSEGVKVSEQRSDDVSVTPKGAIQPALKRSFSRSGSAVGQEAPKERVVPPPSKAPTSALRIDRFLRPFTLKAVQELLGKTGTVTDFWMDNIKTHCYVSYSSVEEAVETRNAVYNLQWPTNGGRFLVAEFVDPSEVKARLEPPPPPPPQASAAPVGASARNPAPQPVPPTQPSPRLQVQKQQPQQQTFLPPPPPPPLENPPAPAIRDHQQQQPPVKERLTLPPPPPLPEKADPPIVTLDDLFRKTKATPRIYYLPLTEEQVAEKLEAIVNEDVEGGAEKLQAIGKTVKQ